MIRTSTPWLTALASFGLAAAAWSTWVHYQILNSPTYESFCDVNSTLNCTAAYTSRFGAIGGVPVALFGLLFFAGVLGVIALCSSSETAAANVPGYVFAASTIGLAVVLYLAYASYFILHVVCLLCAGTYVAVIGLFLISGAATNVPLTSLPMRILNDLKLLVRTPRALSATVVFIGVAAAAIMVFPEQRVTAATTGGDEQTQGAPAAAAASTTQIQQLEKWLSEQPRVTVMAPSDGAAVVIVKFNDYQCPGCGQTYRDYKPVLAKWAKQAPGKVKFITKDYPLERQCNAFVAQDLHSGACEAAVAVRLAREKGKAEAMEEWLYSNQPAMNPDTVKKAAGTVAGITDFDARFPATLELVKADVAQGGQLKIGGTPTFFMNGMALPGLRGEFFDAAIAWELRRVSGAK
ncbi:MAG TPA: vitamin K epoxide reductase family protein [Vicinamibacterales bacterium]|nr:vitamin K epoxide reductase family protein [Vicinamibacterales bacterium]